MANVSLRVNYPIDEQMMSFDLDKSLTLPQDLSRWISASKNLIIGMLTVDVADATLHDVCSVCMEGFQSGKGGKQVPCGHVYHQAYIAVCPHTTNLVLFAVSKSSKRTRPRLLPKVY